jgi:hypothetical protein
MEVTQTQDLIDKIKIVRTENKKFKKKNGSCHRGNSHAKGHAAEVFSNLQKNFEVSGIVMPGSRLEAITHLAKRERNSLTKEDVVVVWGGANDMNKNE